MFPVQDSVQLVKAGFLENNTLESIAVRMPKLVKLEFVTVDCKLVPVNCSAAVPLQ